MEHVQVNGVSIPALGFGTWQLRGQACREGVADALELGYRHIDTARMYGNEREVGQGIADAGVDRDEVFLVTKIRGSDLDADSVARETQASLRELDTDRIDLLLIHHPSDSVPLEETLEAMRREQEAGRVVHLGVSNFDANLMRQALDLAPIVANQVKYHPGIDVGDLLELARRHGVTITAYSPIAKGSLPGRDVLEEIGQAHGKTAEQVALRWLLDQDQVTTIPRSSSHEHRAQNIDVFDFELTQQQRERIDGLAA